MRAGDLVRITRASIGIPTDTLAMIVRIIGKCDDDIDLGGTLFKVLLLSSEVHPNLLGSNRRYWSEDLVKVER